MCYQPVDDSNILHSLSDAACWERAGAGAKFDPCDTSRGSNVAASMVGCLREQYVDAPLTFRIVAKAPQHCRVVGSWAEPFQFHTYVFESVIRLCKAPTLSTLTSPMSQDGA